MSTSKATYEEVVLAAAIESSGDPQRAREWYEKQRLEVLGGQTPCEPVEQGQVDEVLKYSDMLQWGYAG